MSDKPFNRKTLKNLFGNLKRPTASNFGSLIDSMVNKMDDGISKNLKDGLTLAPEGKDSKRVISFKDNIADALPKWSIELQQEETQGLGFVQPISETETKTRLFFDIAGNIGVNTEVPKTDFDVNGILGAQSKVGTYRLDSVPADGKWHDIITDLNGCCAFEIMAQVGKEKSGKYALLHAHALSTFGHSKSKIKSVQAHYSWWWWNKLALRWTGSTYNYKLQLRTRSNYGTDLRVKYYVTKLWDNEIMELFNK